MCHYLLKLTQPRMAQRILNFGFCSVCSLSTILNGIENENRFMSPFKKTNTKLRGTFGAEGAGTGRSGKASVTDTPG